MVVEVRFSSLEEADLRGSQGHSSVVPPSNGPHPNDKLSFDTSDLLRTLLTFQDEPLTRISIFWDPTCKLFFSPKKMFLG